MSVGDLKSFSDNQISRIQVAIPCVVDAFIENGAEEPFVNVIPSLRRKKFIEDRQVEFEDKELIEEVPIGYFSNQGFAITIPIEKGDRGWLIASDFNMDLWDIEGEPFSDLDSSGFKNFADSCWFMPGLWPRPKGLDGYSSDAMVLRTTDNLTHISISPGKIEINADEIVMNGIVITTVNPQDPPFDVLPGTAAEEKEVNRP